MSQQFGDNFMMRFTRSVPAAIAFLAVGLTGSPTLAEAIPIDDYLKSMDRTSVSFSGRIRYDSREDSFMFYDENRDYFRVTMDAGRSAREQIEKDCDRPGFMPSYSDFCIISGTGTIEIRGSAIYISIEDVGQIGK